MSNTVRIVGGEWRRRVLRFPDSEGLRPTPDRVRETLFNWLGQDLDGLSCLDLFAGSGALGFEAASRGAERVVMIEKSPKVAAALHSNASLLGAGTRVEIVRGDALQYAAACAGRPRFDVVFLDPPYRCGWLDKTAPHLDALLAPDGWLYAEAERELATLPGLPGWQVVRHGKAGEVHFHLLRKED